MGYPFDLVKIFVVNRQKIIRSKIKKITKIFPAIPVL